VQSWYHQPSARRQVLMMVKTESPADLAYLDALIKRNPEYTKRDLSTGKALPHHAPYGTCAPCPHIALPSPSTIYDR